MRTGTENEVYSLDSREIFEFLVRHFMAPNRIYLAPSALHTWNCLCYVFAKKFAITKYYILQWNLNLVVMFVMETCRIDLGPGSLMCASIV